MLMQCFSSTIYVVLWQKCCVVQFRYSADFFLFCIHAMPVLKFSSVPLPEFPRRVLSRLAVGSKPVRSFLLMNPISRYVNQPSKC